MNPSSEYESGAPLLRGDESVAATKSLRYILVTSQAVKSMLAVWTIVALGIAVLVFKSSPIASVVVLVVWAGIFFAVPKRTYNEADRRKAMHDLQFTTDPKALHTFCEILMDVKRDQRSFPKLRDTVDHVDFVLHVFQENPKLPGPWQKMMLTNWVKDLKAAKLDHKNLIDLEAKLAS